MVVSMIQKVKKYIEKYHMIEDGDTLVLGVSGGADSVCLLLVLQEYAKEHNLSLFVVHMNHMIRKEAATDAAYVKQLCEVYKIPFFLFEKEVEQIAKENNISTEEAGRNVRYEAFYKVLQEQAGGVGKIAVAHNQGDCAETLLFHMFRGTGLNGMAGILPVRNEIIRPLLSTSRKEIEAYLRENDIAWCEDVTNGENVYTRNKIRNEILPYVEEKITNGATKHLAQTAEQMLELRQFIKTETRKVIEKIVCCDGNDIRIAVEEFKQVPEFLQKQVLLEVISDLTKGGKDITAKHLESVKRLFVKQGTKQINLPYGVLAKKEYNIVVLTHKKEKEVTNLYNKMEIPGNFMIPTLGKLSATIISDKNIVKIPENSYTKWFDYDKIIHCPAIRNRKTGDFLTINDSFQRKTVKEYMIQEKIPKESRGQLPLIADGGHVMWIPGYRISAYYKVTEATINILELKIENE